MILNFFLNLLKLKALLLAAGLGTRLRPLTLTTPKCLIEINGEPLLINWLNKLEKIGCDEVLINTHYLPLQVENAIKKWGQHNLKITITFEEKLLGTKPAEVFNGGKSKQSARKTSMEEWGYKWVSIPNNLDKNELGITPNTSVWWSK